MCTITFYPSVILSQSKVKPSTSNQNWGPKSNSNSNLKRVRCDLIADYKLAITVEDKYESKEEKCEAGGLGLGLRRALGS